MRPVFSLSLLLATASLVPAATPPFAPKPIPRVLAVPQPHDQVSFQREGREIARYHHGPELRRPFIFPLVGPSGAVLTRMGHPRDPVGHIHHNSFWVAHHDVNGTTFWGDRATNAGRIVHQRLEPILDDAGDVASVTAHNAWIDPAGRTLLLERRQMVVSLLPREEYFVVLDLEFTLPKNGKAVTFGKTSFGPVAVRMAKSIGVHDGGGRIRNSEGAVNEKDIFWKPARWVDYSGASTGATVEGITLMDHPMNPQHPAPYHVRDDGWMGACLSQNEPVTVTVEKPLRVRYAVYVHRDLADAKVINARWEEFVKLKLPETPPRK